MPDARNEGAGITLGERMETGIGGNRVWGHGCGRKKREGQGRDLYIWSISYGYQQASRRDGFSSPFRFTDNRILCLSEVINSRPCDGNDRTRTTGDHESHASAECQGIPLPEKDRPRADSQERRDVKL